LSEEPVQINRHAPEDKPSAEAEAVAADAPASAPADTAVSPMELTTADQRPVAPAVAVPAEAAIVEETVVVLRRKHLLASRWMHWINFPLLGIMIWSGLLIYWAQSDAANLHPHEVYRIGIGNWTLVRFFPDWFYAKLGMPFRLAEGLGWHFFFMWLFGVNGILYVIYTFVSGEWRDLVPNRNSMKEAWQVLLHDLYLSKEHPPVRKYNGAQQIAYTMIVLAGAGSLVTGLAIYKPAQLHVLTSLLGGYEFARFLHFWLMMSYVGFFAIHIMQVIRAGWNNFRSMVTGYELVEEKRVRRVA
jgi:thiosulfate reductase cytochrome b subunit